LPTMRRNEVGIRQTWPIGPVRQLWELDPVRSWLQSGLAGTTCTYTHVGERGAMTQKRKARALGVNHVALEVGDIDEALAFYGRLFEFKLRGKSKDSAFIDLGDQFLALQKGRTQPGDDGRHFGLVVDDKEAVREALLAVGVKVLPGRFLDFLDPW